MFVSDLLSDLVFRSIRPAVPHRVDASGDGAGHTLTDPGAMVTDPLGNLYVAGERSHNVFRVSPSGTVTEMVNGSAPLDYPTALAMDELENLYVGDFGTYHRVLRVSPSSTITIVQNGVDVVGLAVRADGVVLIADSNGQKITGVRPSGLGCVVIDASGDGVHPFGFASRFVLRDDGVVFASNVSFDGVFEIANSCPDMPSVDAGGLWRVSVTYPPNDYFPPPPPSTFLQDWTQTGFDLTVSDPSTSMVTFTGTIDDRNHFNLSSVAATCIVPGFCCPLQTIYGDVAAAADEWVGPLSDNFFDIRADCGSPFEPAVAFGTRCGNGNLDAGETCDDGNWTNGDGCDAACGLGSLCGNGVVEPGEECDDGNRLRRDGCSPSCQIEILCGDGVLDFGETCDDHNLTDGDGCDDQCQLEPCYQCNGSSNGYICIGKVILGCTGKARSRGSMLKMRAGSPSRPPRLRWESTTDGPLAMNALGDPTSHTSYHLCVFDRSQGAPRVLASSSFLPGRFWRSNSNGYTYREKSEDERKSVRVRNRANAKLRAWLWTPELQSLSLPLPATLTVQVQTDDAGCFSAKFSPAGVLQNDSGGCLYVSDP